VSRTERRRKAPAGKPVTWAVPHYDQVLPNGLRLLCVPRESANRAVVTMLVRVGSRFESDETNGISHFLEHMLYRGCGSKKTAHQQALAFETLGGTLYAATQSDYGSLSLTVPPESLDRALATFADVAVRPRFSAIEIERGIVREEILEDLDDDGRQIDADNLTRGLIYGRHPLGYTITGSLAGLERFDQAMLGRHHARHYVGGNSVLCLSGKVDPDRCMKLASRLFADLPKGRRVAAGRPPTRQREPRFLHVPNVASQTDLRIAFRAFGDGDRREPATEMLLRVLDDGMSTRLYDRICDSRGLCYEVGALYESYEDDGVFDVAAEVQHHRVVEVAREIRCVLAELCDHGPTDRELATAKARDGWQMQAMLDDCEALGGFYALSELARLTRTPLARHEELCGVTKEDVRLAAETIFRPEVMSVVTVGTMSKEQARALSGAVLNQKSG
jgi:predicted Zn-dependent peptidase